MAKTLHVSISNRIATYSQRDGSIICGNSDYEIKFAFDAEWSSHQTKTARFLFDESAVDVLFDGDTVTVPILRNVLALTVGVFAGNLQTTTPALIPCVKSILCDDGLPPDPEPDVYTQMMETLNRYEDATTRIEEMDAEVTEFMESTAETLNKFETDVSDFIGESTEKINGLETEVSDYSERIGTLESDVADLLYAQNPLTITSFSVTPLSKEKGITVNSASLMWSLNKTPTTLFADGIQLPLEKAGSYALGSETDDDEKLGITTDHTWTLAATDERGKTVTKKATLTFYNGVYYGVSEAPATYDSAFIIALGKSGKKVLRGSKLTSFEETAGEGEYIYYCLPVSMGECTFTVVGSLPGGFDLVATLDGENKYENEHGHKEAYRIYRSTNAGLGKTPLEVM